MQWFLVCSKIMKVSPLPNSRTFSSPQIETLYLLAVTPHSHVPSMDFPIRGISYAWNHVIFALLCLMQRWHNGFRFHPSCNMYHSPISFLGLNNIPVGLPWWLSGKKNLPAMQETRIWFLSWEDPLGKEIATHSSILAWEIPWTEESGGLQSKGLQKSRTWLSN